MKTRQILTELGPVAVTENQGRGRSIVFLHGSSMSAASFGRQFAGLGEAYHLVALDFPGHGLSPAATDPARAYSFSSWDSILREVHPRLALRSPVYVGQSMGGHVVLENLPELEGVAGALLVGSAPFDNVASLRRIFLPGDPSEGALFAEQLSEEGIGKLASAFTGPFASASDRAFVSASLRRADGSFRRHLGASLGSLRRRREVEVACGGSHSIAIVQGRHDRFINPAYFEEIGTGALWGGKVHFLEKSGHLPHIEEPGAFNSLLQAFVQSV